MKEGVDIQEGRNCREFLEYCHSQRTEIIYFCSCSQQQNASVPKYRCKSQESREIRWLLCVQSIQDGRISKPQKNSSLLLFSGGFSSLLPSIFILCYLGVAQKISMTPWEKIIISWKDIQKKNNLK